MAKVIAAGTTVKATWRPMVRTGDRPVKRDVAAGYVTPEGAQRDYGVKV